MHFLSLVQEHLEELISQGDKQILLLEEIAIKPVVQPDLTPITQLLSGLPSALPLMSIMLSHLQGSSMNLTSLARTMSTEIRPSLASHIVDNVTESANTARSISAIEQTFSSLLPRIDRVLSIVNEAMSPQTGRDNMSTALMRLNQAYQTDADGTYVAWAGDISRQLHKHTAIAQETCVALTRLTTQLPTLLHEVTIIAQSFQQITPYPSY